MRHLKTANGQKDSETGDHFKFVPLRGTGGDSLKLKDNRSKLELRAWCFANQAVLLMHRFPESDVRCKLVETFEQALNTVAPGFVNKNVVHERRLSLPPSCLCIFCIYA